MRPLDGITVVSLEHAIAAPFCTRHLADMGARVIKIERPGQGDFARGYDDRARGLSSHFMWVNRSKESLAIDIKTDEGRAVLAALLEKADILVQNLSPGAAARLGLSHADLAPRHPRLIVCNISGYGPDGPHRDRKAYDLLIQAEAGLLSITGTADARAKAGISIADIAAGAYAYSSILAALIARQKTGQGSEIDISMLECMAEWMGYPLYYATDGAEPPARLGAAHASIYPYGPFRVGDGGMVMLAVQNPREWVAFCAKVLQQPALADDPRFATNAARSANRDAVDIAVDAVFSTLRVEEVEARLEAAGIANARLNDMQGLWNHPQLKARDRWVSVETPVGPMPALLPPGLPRGVAPRMDPVPAPGAHNAAIFEELGFQAAGERNG